MRKSKQFVIAGFGPTTVAVVRALVTEGHVDPNDIVVVDNQLPLAQFRAMVDNIGMVDMRSPWTVSVERNNDALYRYAKEAGLLPHCYTRPRFTDFQAHALAVLGQNMPTVVEGRIKAIAKGQKEGRWILQTDAGGLEIETSNAVFATGLVPHRVKPLQNTVELPRFPLGSPEGKVAIIGGGMTASNAALTLIERGNQVVMIAPGGLKNEQSGRNGWLTGPTGDGSCVSEGADDARARFLRLSPQDRYQALRTSAIDGTITADHLEGLRTVGRKSRNAITIIDDRATEVVQKRGTFEVRLKGAAMQQGFAVVYDARGFHPAIENLSAIQGLADAIGKNRFEELPLVNDKTGYVRPGLYVAGCLSAMSFGPAAGTVAGGVMLGHTMAANIAR